MTRRRRTTRDVLREREADFEREQQARRDAFDAVTPLAEGLCDAGLVDDVTPSNPRPAPAFHCTRCGAPAPADWCGEACACGSLMWRVT